MEIYKLPKTYIGSVVKRPSKTSKTPYVADIILENDTTNTEYMAHTAALGCCGMVDSGKEVIMINSPNPKNVCKYKIMLAKTIERGKINIVGVDPNIAEDLVEECIKQNLISSLKNVKKYKRQATISSSRFDFIGLDCNETCFILEVKNVPLADYVDCYEKERKKMDFSDRHIDSKIAYFPDGYRKKQKDTVSPRALKHITELTNIKKDYKDKIRCIMCYVIQRRDVESFQASNVDSIYKEAFSKATVSGVEIIPLQIEWKEDGTAHFICDDLTINIITLDKDITKWLGAEDSSGNMIDGSNVFVYGQRVKDFNILKKDAIWTITTSAVQEIDRQQQLDKQEIADLKARLTALENN